MAKPWEVKGGELYFDGRVCRPTADWPKSFLDERVRKMKELIAKSQYVRVRPTPDMLGVAAGETSF